MRHTGSTLRATRARIPWCPGDGSARAVSSPFSIRPAGESKAGLQTPTVLLSPVHGGPSKNAGHRTYQTIEGLGSRLGIKIDSAFAHGPGVPARRQRGERPLRRRADLLGAPPHPDDRLGAAGGQGTVIPSAWPKHRYDVVWTFTLVPDAATAQYAFGQIPQLLLSGDSDSVIPCCSG